MLCSSKKKKKQVQQLIFLYFFNKKEGGGGVKIAEMSIRFRRKINFEFFFQLNLFKCILIQLCKSAISK